MDERRWVANGVGAVVVSRGALLRASAASDLLLCCCCFDPRSDQPSSYASASSVVDWSHVAPSRCLKPAETRSGAGLLGGCSQCDKAGTPIRGFLQWMVPSGAELVSRLVPSYLPDPGSQMTGTFRKQEQLGRFTPFASK